MTQLHPKQAMSWYAVGCYYWTCHKLEQAHKYLVKSTQLDKRFVQAYLMLGHVLAAQEEREHAVSAFRTACRLLPGDHRPVVLMAKELVKTGSVSLALHLLWTALESGECTSVRWGHTDILTTYMCVRNTMSCHS